jgi:hypothetical protein
MNRPRKPQQVAAQCWRMAGLQDGETLRPRRTDVPDEMWDFYCRGYTCGVGYRKASLARGIRVEEIEAR